MFTGRSCRHRGPRTVRADRRAPPSRFELLMTGHDPGVETVQEAVADRVTGNSPSRLKSALAAASIGFAAAALAYRLLRSGADGSQQTGAETE
jgi:hypothetical protein